VTVSPEVRAASARDGLEPLDVLAAAPLRSSAEEEIDPVSGGGSLSLVAASCPLCGDADAEPVAVAEDFDYRTSLDSFLALRCTGCGSVYASPAPAEHELPRIYPTPYFAASQPQDARGLRRSLGRRREARRLAQWCQGLGPGARILDVGCGGGLHLRLLQELGAQLWRLEGVEPSEAAVQIGRTAGLEVHRGKMEDLDLDRRSYDLALLIGTLEHVFDPLRTLTSVRSLLQPGGRAVIVVNNLASPSFPLFGGRHWGGYDLPRQRRLFTADGLRRLARSTGLEVASLSTLSSADTWMRSANRLLQDWGAPAWLVDRFGISSLVTATAFGALEAVLQLRGRGALLVAILRCPEGEADQ
jgi:SAM-dependent methyltransferase